MFFGVPNSLKNKLWFSGPVLYCVLEGSISFSSFVVAILVVSETLMHADMLMSEYLEISRVVFVLTLKDHAFNTISLES